MSPTILRKKVSAIIAASVLLTLSLHVSGLDDVTGSVDVIITDPGGGQGFSRGDANQDGGTDISDAVAILGFLFGGAHTTCQAAMDVNDDESTNIADAVYMLSYLFAGASSPPFPFGAGVCGSDRTPGPLTCVSFNPTICTGSSSTRFVKLVHAGASEISLPIIVYIEDMQGAGVTIANADGTRNGKPYFDYSKYVPGSTFGTDDETKEREWKFTNPGGSDFSLVVRVEGSMGTRGWLPGMDVTRPGTGLPTRKVEEMEFDSISYKIEVPGFMVKQRSIHRGAKQERFQSILTPFNSILRTVGKPAIPTHTQLVAVPKGAKVTATAKTGKVITYENFRILPTQIEPIDEKGDPFPFFINEKFYLRNELYPKTLVSVTEGMMRGMRLLVAKTALARYNCATRDLHVYSDIEVTINFEGPKAKGPGDFVDEAQRAPGFEAFMETAVLNHSHAVIGHELVASGRIFELLFRDFLIITDPDFVDQANELSEWKNNHGLRTYVATTDATGSTREEIVDHIESAYNLRGIEYVLLLGDTEFIPTFYESRHPIVEPNGHSPKFMGSDLFYVTIDGPTPAGTRDYFPDMAIGRLPVDTAAEAQSMVDAIKAYESWCGPSSPGDFYSEPTLVAYFQDDDPRDGTADRGYVETIEEIATFLTGEGYTPNRVYTAKAAVDPEEYFDGTDIPWYLLRDNGFDWDGTDDDVVDHINDGTFILAHRDHGDRGGWSHPSFGNNDIDDLTNGNVRPLVFSINCQTGWFDNETDEAAYGTTNASECFAEDLLREPDGGAIGVLTPTRNSPSWANNHLLLGMLDCVWAGLLPDFPGDDDDAADDFAGSRRLGHILNYGKLRVFAEYGDDDACDSTEWWCDNFDDISMSQWQFEMYHCLGDPTLRLRTARPFCFMVALPVFELLHTEYAIPINPSYEGALVSIIQDGDVVGQDFVHDGEVNVILREALSSEDAYFVIDKEGYAPLRKKMEFEQTSTCDLYTLQLPVPLTTSGPIRIGAYNIQSNGDLLFKELQTAAGTGQHMCCDSGFAGNQDYLFAGANQSNAINMFRFEKGGELTPLRGSPFSTKGGPPTSFAVNSRGLTLYALTAPDLVEVFYFTSSGLAQEMAPVKFKRKALKDIATLSLPIFPRPLRPPYFREYLYVGNDASIRDKEGVTVLRKGSQDLEEIQFVDLTKASSRPGYQICIAEDKRFLYLLDLDNGIFCFSINTDGTLAPIGNGPADTGGYCGEICLTNSENILFAYLPAIQSSPTIFVYGIMKDGSLNLLHRVKAYADIFSLKTDCDDRYLYGACRGGSGGVYRWEIMKNGDLEDAGFIPDKDKGTTPQMLWIRAIGK